MASFCLIWWEKTEEWLGSRLWLTSNVCYGHRQGRRKVRDTIQWSRAQSEGQVWSPISQESLDTSGSNSLALWRPAQGSSMKFPHSTSVKWKLSVKQLHTCPFLKHSGVLVGTKSWFKRLYCYLFRSFTGRLVLWCLVSVSLHAS